MSCISAAMGLHLRAFRWAALSLTIVLIHSPSSALGATDNGDLFDAKGESAGTGHVHKKHHKEGEGWRLLRHSFDRTLTFDDTLADWHFSGASMALRDRVEMLPPVPDRFGIGFNKRPVETSDFEAKFSMGAVSPGTSPEDGYFAFWVSSQNYSADLNDLTIVTDPEKNWQKGMVSKGLTLFGNKPAFQGLCLAFFQQDGKQMIAGLWNDGSRSVSMQDFTSKDKHKEVDWLNKVIEVSLRLEKNGAVVAKVAAHAPQDLISGSTWSWSNDGVKVDSVVKFEKDGTTVPAGSWSIQPQNKLKLEFKSQSHTKHYLMRLEGAYRADVIEGGKEPRPTMMRFEETGEKQPSFQTTWHELISMPAGTHSQPKSFIGFTGWTGKNSYVEADLHKLFVTNMDTQTIGEQDGGEAVEGGMDPQWLKLIANEKKFLDQATQAEAVLELTKFLTEHVEHYETIANKLKADLAAMEGRVEGLGSDIAGYLSLLQAFNFDSSQFDPLEVKSHILGIRAVLTKAAERGGSKLGEVHEAAKVLKAHGGGTKISESSKKKAQSVQMQSETVEQFAAQGARQTNIMLVILVISVAGLGAMFFGRMRYYEKKHYI